MHSVYGGVGTVERVRYGSKAAASMSGVISRDAKSCLDERSAYAACLRAMAKREVWNRDDARAR